MPDPLDLVFDAVLVGITAILLFAYLSFARMHPEVRRARLFIMADRIGRFLLGFTVGFLGFLVVLLLTAAGVVLPPAVSYAAFFLSIGTILYGSIELLLIAHPIREPFAAQPAVRRGSP
jgi:hypothetical protein